METYVDKPKCKDFNDIPLHEPPLQVSNLSSLHIYCLIRVNKVVEGRIPNCQSKKNAARLGKTLVIHVTRGGRRGKKHLLQTSPSNCKISLHNLVLKQKVAKDHARPRLLKTTRD